MAREMEENEFTVKELVYVYMHLVRVKKRRKKQKISLSAITSTHVQVTDDLRQQIDHFEDVVFGQVVGHGRDAVGHVKLMENSLRSIVIHTKVLPAVVRENGVSNKCTNSDRALRY